MSYLRRNAYQSCLDFNQIAKVSFSPTMSNLNSLAIIVFPQDIWNLLKAARFKRDD